MRELRAHGLAIGVPTGWEGTIVRRPPGRGDITLPVVHVASFPLPVERGDFGAGAVETMRADDVFLALFEYGPESADRPLFPRLRGPLQVRPQEFSPTMLQRLVPGQAGVQRFFTMDDRAFSLYVVVGAFARRFVRVPAVNSVLSTLTVERGRPG